MGESVHQLLERNARKYPSGVAVRWPQGDMTLTWSELNNGANALARFLQAKGFARGERTVIFVSNRPEFVTAFYGVLKAGGVVIPLNIKFTPPEIAYVLENSEASVIIYEDDLRTVVENAVKSFPELVGMTLSTRDIPGLKYKYGGEDFNQDISPGETAEILYTSGTTGKPKGVLMTHMAIISVGSMMAYEADVRFGDRFLHLMPLTHSAPLNLMLVGGTWAGASHILGTFTPQTLLDLTDQEKTTHFFGAPVVYNLTGHLPNFNSYDLTSAKRWIYGGSPTPKADLDRMMQLFPGDLMSVYGLTEAGPNGMILYPHEHPRYAGSIGCRGGTNCEVRVVGPNGRDIFPGEIGEIILKTHTHMVGYHKRPGDTAETLRDGWIYTGDLAERDAEGYVWIKDRKKDMIITGGVNVYPKEVEDVLSFFPGIADAAVAGIPHPDWGETVMALVVAAPGQKPDPEEIRQFCRQRLAGYKVPRIIEFIDVIPRNITGKIQKHLIREKYGKHGSALFTDSIHQPTGN